MTPLKFGTLWSNRIYGSDRSGGGGGGGHCYGCAAGVDGVAVAVAVAEAVVTLEATNFV